MLPPLRRAAAAALLACLAAHSFLSPAPAASGQLIRDECGLRAPLLGLRRVIRIFSGREVFRARDWPWHVKLRVKFTRIGDENSSSRRTKTRHCAGTLARLWTVATAAHCVTDRTGLWRLDAVEVAAGSVSSRGDRPGGQVRFARYVYVHHKFEGNSVDRHHYDIAILSLDSSFYLTDFVRPVCIPDLRDPALKHGQKCHITGFGRSSDAGEPVVTRLVEASVVVDRRRPGECHSDLVCLSTYQGGKICEGDSGGPLVCEVDGTWLLYGVAGGAFQPGSCEYNPSGTYFVSVMRHLSNITASDWVGSALDIF